MNRIWRFSFTALVAACLILPLAPLGAQTNFVKYTGNPVLPLGSPGAWDDTEAAYATVLFDGAAYQMWYSGAPWENSYRIGYATSADGLNWVKDATNPVLKLGGSGTFDSISLWLPAIHFDSSRYEMWYSGGLTVSEIGYATAPDPASWARHQSTPVLGKGGSGTWDESYTFHPVVIRSDTLYHMWYSGQSANGLWQTGYATSTDGINWTRHPDNPVLRVGAAGEWDSRAALAGSVIFADGQYHMWYHGSNRSDNSQVNIGYATSTDGVNWTRHGDNPILQPGPSNWDAKNVWFSTVIKDGHRYRMWYTATAPGTTIDRLGYAEDFSNAAHVERIQASPQSVAAGSGTILIEAHIANPHNETVSAKALIVSNDGSVNDSIDLNDGDQNGVWWAEWEIPDEVRDYSVGVELNNLSAGYVHNSFHWGVFEEFSASVPTHEFAEIASIHDGDDGEAHNVIVALDNSVLLANGPDGLRSYAFDGVSFSGVAHIDDGGSARGVVQATDGTVFLANGSDGLRAYGHDGQSFTSLAHVDDGGTAMALVLATDGTIFLANGSDGVRAYSYDGSAFINTAHHETQSIATDMVVAEDGTIFLANDYGGLMAIEYDSGSFARIAHADDGIYSDSEVALAADGTIFLANGDGGLRAYSYDGASLTLIAHNGTRDWPQGLAVAGDGTIFLACRGSVVSPGGLYAYTFDGTSFTITAQFMAGLTTRDATAAADGVLFIANGERGLRAFTYAPKTPTSVTGATASRPSRYALHQNYPNPFNPATTIAFSLPQSSFVTVKVYNLLGNELATVLQAHKPAGRHTVSFDASNLASGLYYYTLTAGDPSAGSGQAIQQSRKMLLLR